MFSFAAKCFILALLVTSAAFFRVAPSCLDSFLARFALPNAAFTFRAKSRDFLRSFTSFAAFFCVCPAFLCNTRAMCRLFLAAVLISF
jgi:hypothetical protein